MTTRTPTRRPKRNTRLAAAIAVDGRPRYLIAAAAQLNASAFGGVVSGRVVPSAELRRRIAGALRVPEAELFDEAS
jgi:transcriptional regulator with XRE-family HTH domain